VESDKTMALISGENLVNSSRLHALKTRRGCIYGPFPYKNTWFEINRTELISPSYLLEMEQTFVCIDDN